MYVKARKQKKLREIFQIATVLYSEEDSKNYETKRKEEGFQFLFTRSIDEIIGCAV